MSLGRGPCACNNLERFETRISHLYTDAVLAVLKDGVVQV